MRIGDALAFLARGASASVRPIETPGTSQERAAVLDVPEVDVVQLTLHSDGIWQIVPSLQSDTSFARTLHRPALPVSRFYPAATQLYASTGRLQASAPARGAVLDIYV